jgi:hypothetical protein
MRCVVFLGPTLSHDAARAVLDATYLPPVAQGDLLRVAKERPFAIGIIDGYFERLPAVWHKEILWALSQGIHVFGGASMGALRAAELEPFGMRGIGAIFEAYQAGALEDDDEVAVAHGDAESGFRAISEALVNIRATLRRANRSGIAPETVTEKIEAIAKGLFYPERIYPNLFARALEGGVGVVAVDALRAFVAANPFDQKREDALALLKALRACMNDGRPAGPATFHFEHTEAWDRVLDWSETQPPLTPTERSFAPERVASEVRLLGWRGRAIFAEAMNRVAAGILARRSDIPDRGLRTTAAHHRLRPADRVDERRGTPAGGTDHERLERWLAERGLTRATYEELVASDVDLAWLKERYREEVPRHVAHALRSTGDYVALAERAREKENLLARSGLESVTLAEAGIDEDALMVWYFERRLGATVPADLEAYLAEMGIADRATLQREALRELIYTRQLAVGG